MTENQIYSQTSRAAALVLGLILMSGCYPAKRMIVQPEVPRDYWTEKKQRISPHQKRAVLEALERVRKKAASGSSLDSLGISTLKESVVLLDHPSAAAPFIADAIEGRDLWSGIKGESYYWKFRYWCIDMAGYMDERQFAGMLASIVSREDEKDELRIRAVMTLREMKEKESLRKLFMEMKNSAVREEIARALLYFD
ncbi:hypothetical protein KKF70_04760 [bacterium]|nr:hypothetical protein [bacterium]